MQRNRIAPTTERATVASLLRTSIGDRFGLELVDTRKYSKRISLIASVKLHYYSFKIFPQFLLAKSTRIIHHNQLLMTKFGRILYLTRKWRQKCSLLRVKAPLPRRLGKEVKLFWLWKKSSMFDWIYCFSMKDQLTLIHRTCEQNFPVTYIHQWWVCFPKHGPQLPASVMKSNIIMKIKLNCYSFKIFPNSDLLKAHR